MKKYNFFHRVQWIFLGLLISFWTVGHLLGYTEKTLETKVKIERTKDIDSLKNTELTVESVKYWLDYYQVQYSEIVINQVKVETGHFKSYGCRVRNNLFGFHNGKRYLVFDNWIESIIFYKKWQSKYYCEEKYSNYYTFLEDIGYSTNYSYIELLKSMNSRN